jgi:hypothetical protein
MLERESTPIPPLGPGTKIEIQEHVDQRETGEENDGADRRHGLNQPDSVVDDRPPVSLYPVEEMRGSLDSRTAVAGSPGEEMSEQHISRAQSASGYVACVLGQTDPVEWGEQAQPQSEKPAGAGLEGTPSKPTEQKGPDEKTHHSDPTQHYYRTERLFSAEPFTSEESDQGDGEPKTADPTNPTNESQESNSISSASSNAKSDNHATIETSSNPISTRNEGMSAFDITDFTVHSSPRSPRAR